MIGDRFLRLKAVKKKPDNLYDGVWQTQSMPKSIQEFTLQ